MKHAVTRRAIHLMLAFVLVLANFTGIFAVETHAKTSEVTADELFISEYVEGSSFNKAIEIYNGTGESVDLSEYELSLYSNGAGEASQSMDLSGIIEHGDVLVIAHSNADPEILAQADETNNAVINFNGDDAVSLNKNEEVIDVFGEIGVRENFGKDVTMVRIPEVTGPTEEFNEAEWDEYPNNTFAYLGSHVMDGVDPAESPEEPVEPEYTVIEPKKNNGTATVHNKEFDKVQEGDHVLINIFNEKKPRKLLLNKKQVDLLKDNNVYLTVTNGVTSKTIQMTDVKTPVLKVSLH